MIEALWHITVGSWITAGAIVILRLLFRKHLSAKSKYMLWLLLLLRLMLPVLPESPFGVISGAEKPNVTAAATEFQHSESSSSAVIAYTGTTENRLDESEMLLCIWLTGMLLCGCIYGIMTVQTARRLRSMEQIQSIGIRNRYEAIRKQLGIRRTIALRYGDRAMIGGLLHPTLILPRELTGQRLKAAITHELMHYKSGDLWITALWRVVSCVHWFNPVVWLCFLWARRDCEKACDQRVLDSESVSPAVYAALLYEEATMKRTIHVGTTAFGGGGLKDRIRCISTYRKPKISMTVLAVCLCLLISVCTMTQSKVASAEATQGSANIESLNGGSASTSLYLHALCQKSDDVKFNPVDHDYFWRVMSYYAATQELNTDSAYIEQTPEQVVQMAQVAFPQLEITGTELLPGIPGYISEDGAVPPVEQMENGNYRFARRNIEYSMETEQLTSKDGLYQLAVTLINDAGSSEGTWNVTIDSRGTIRSMKAI